MTSNSTVSPRVPLHAPWASTGRLASTSILYIYLNHRQRSIIIYAFFSVVFSTFFAKTILAAARCGWTLFCSWLHLCVIGHRYAFGWLVALFSSVYFFYYYFFRSSSPCTTKPIINIMCMYNVHNNNNNILFANQYNAHAYQFAGAFEGLWSAHQPIDMVSLQKDNANRRHFHRGGLSVRRRGCTAKTPKFYFCECIYTRVIDLFGISSA